MPITLNRKVQFSHPDFVYTGNNYIEYLYGAIGMKVNANIVLEVAWSTLLVNATFETTGDTIKRIDGGLSSFFLDGFKIGDTITITASVSNNISTTITDISDDGRTLTVAANLVNETANACNIFGTPIKSELSKSMPTLLPTGLGGNGGRVGMVKVGTCSAASAQFIGIKSGIIAVATVTVAKKLKT